MTCTEGREPSGLAKVSLSRVLGDVRRYRNDASQLKLQALVILGAS
ncbi:hypothetical protein Poly59_31150 [Rubripirellula reticaptiva]|uniref:Uncharacterized protein n=1 Tax=Rubripirellula reticaptiva TaxID=2528013 RepID=A0A5C6EP40_9BACT|nr:hypothetical protein Poly59_31150 [Rubripirellula reticaptiva]